MPSFVDITDPDDVRAAGARITASATGLQTRIAGIIARIAEVEATNPFSDDEYTGPAKAEYFAEGPPAQALGIEQLTSDMADLGLRVVTAMAEYEAADSDAVGRISASVNPA
jgi:hypothetical protein